MQILKLLSQIVIPEDRLKIPQPSAPGADNTTAIDTILKIVFGLGGTIAVLVIVIAGIQFMLSQGDPQKSATARSAIIYAAIGLVIMTLAFSIVSFVAGDLLK